jgi:hypothetical protein
VEVAGATGTDVAIEVQDADHNRVLRTSAPDGEAAIVPNVTCAGGCYFRVTPGKKDAATDYTLTLTLGTPGVRSEKEPNNRYVDAQPLALGAPVDGYLAPSDDEDWYLLTPTGLAPDQVIAVNFASPPDVKAELVVARQSDQAPLATYKAADVGQDLKLRDLAPPLAPETGYYLIVRSGWVAAPGTKGRKLANAKVAYTLEAKAVAGAPNLEQEPNDDVTHATPIDLGTPVKSGFLAPKGDVDWFTFKVDQPSIIRADVTGLDRVNLVLSAIDPAKKNDEKDNELGRSDSGDVKEPESLVGIAVPAGENFLRVEGAWKKIDEKFVKDYENVYDTYNLTVTATPDDGTTEREPNDRPERATPVEIGKSYTGYIQPAKDVDLWRLEVKENANVAITLSAVAKLDLMLTVKDAGRDNAMVGTVDKTKVEAEERLVVPFEPGTYLIEVREKGKESNAQKPYTLTLK